MDSQVLNMEKTVLEVDLVRYTQTAVNVQENIGLPGLKMFEDQVRGIINSGLNRVGLNRDEVVLGEAGDNAIMILDNVEVAHLLAQTIYQATVEYNQAKSIESAKRYFRMGAATGELLIDKAERRIIGTVIARAVRLEAAAERGQLVIDSQTFQQLSPETQKQYSGAQIIKSKNGERYKAHRCTFMRPSGDANAWFAQVRHVIRPWWHNHHQ
jgi:class 3 adenylate cyclase